MRKLILAMFLVSAFIGISKAEVRASKDRVHEAGTPVHASVSVVLASTSSTAGVTKSIQRIITNNSDYTVYMTKVGYSVVVTTTTGTPLYTHEHYTEDKWFDRIWFAADPAATGNTCDVRVETQTWQ